jgi:hypothetical protein
MSKSVHISPFQFSVQGPFEIKLTVEKGGKTITKTNIIDFWEKHAEFQFLKGCYIFVLSSSGGQRQLPYYVGKTKKSFSQEMFTTDKLSKYKSALVKLKKSKAHFYFVTPPPKSKGPTNAKYIGELEKYLIKLEAIINPDQVNVQHTKSEPWGISGVIRTQTKKPSSSAKLLKACLGLA